jgi:hypothetical protein
MVTAICQWGFLLVFGSGLTLWEFVVVIGGLLSFLVHDTFLGLTEQTFVQTRKRYHHFRSSNLDVDVPLQEYFSLNLADTNKTVV